MVPELVGELGGAHDSCGRSSSRRREGRWVQTAGTATLARAKPLVARSFPRTAMTSKRPGLAVRPVSATRAGCATSLICSPRSASHAFARASSVCGVHGSTRSRLSARSRRSGALAGDEELRGGRRRPSTGRIAEDEVEPVGRVDERRRALADRAGPRCFTRSRSSPSSPRSARKGSDALDVLVVGREARGLQVLVVDGEELLRVELAVAPVAVLPVERGDELVEREDLLVAVRPAEAREVVEHRVRRVALVAVLGRRSRRRGAC